MCEKGRERECANSHARNRPFELFAAPDHDCEADLKYALMAARFTVAGDIEGLLLPMYAPARTKPPAISTSCHCRQQEGRPMLHATDSLHEALDGSTPRADHVAGCKTWPNLASITFQVSAVQEIAGAEALRAAAGTQVLSSTVQAWRSKGVLKVLGSVVRSLKP